MNGQALPAPRLLVSVRSAAEALMALGGGADIIDIKEPRTGVLGAAAPETIRGIAEAVGGRRRVSATVGDLPPGEDAVAAATATASLGVDYVKIGLFTEDSASVNLAPFASLAARGVRLILVMFADRSPDFALIGQAAAAGFAGVMLDTAAKRHGGLRAHLSGTEIARFLRLARRAGLIAGLAGSLRPADIAPLAALGPDVLGFRGAACAGAVREAALDLEALAELRRLVSGAAGRRLGAGGVAW
jgi:uncharacterized protein (UPF0264 family)